MLKRLGLDLSKESGIVPHVKRVPEPDREHLLCGLGFEVWGLGFGVWGLGFGFGVCGLGFGDWGLGSWIWVLGFRV